MKKSPSSVNSPKRRSSGILPRSSFLLWLIVLVAVSMVLGATLFYARRRAANSAASGGAEGGPSTASGSLDEEIITFPPFEPIVFKASQQSETPGPPTPAGQRPSLPLRPIPNSIAAQPYTTSNCFEVGDRGSSGFVDVLGNGMGTSHFCVLTNVCIENNQEVRLLNKPGYFDDREHPFPRTLYSEIHHAKRVPPESILQTAFQEGRYRSGTTAIFAHSYCCADYSTYLEPLPTFLSGRLAAQGGGKGQKGCSPLNVSCVGEVDWVLHIGRGHFAGGVSPTSWAGNALKIATGIPPSKELRGPQFLVDEDPQYKYFARDPLRCYEKVVVGGAFYNLFATRRVADEWREAAEVFAAEGRKLAAPGSWVREHVAANFSLLKPEHSKVILVIVEKRGTRVMVDADDVVRSLEAVFAPYDVTVRGVDLEQLDFLSQATHVQEADIVVGVHRESLSNMVFMRRGAAVVELNPIFFVESRYREMALKLGLHYDAVTCTSKKCAFGGDEALWNEYLSAGRGRNAWVDDATWAVVTKEFGTFSWPRVGYAGDCELCNKLTCCTDVSQLVTDYFKDSNVRAVPMIKDLLMSLYGVGKKLGWDYNGLGETGFLTAALRQLRLSKQQG